MAGIVEAGDGKTPFRPQSIERLGLGATHDRAEAIEPEEARRRAQALFYGNAARRQSTAQFYGKSLDGTHEERVTFPLRSKTGYKGRKTSENR